MDVQFHEEENMGIRRNPGVRVSGMAKLIMSFGLAKTPRGAQLVLAAILALLLITLYFILRGGGSNTRTEPVPNDFQPGQSAFKR